MPGDYAGAGNQPTILDAVEPNGFYQARLPGDVFNRLEIHMDGTIWAGNGAVPPSPVSGGGLVSSVNGQIGDVQLDAEDVPFTPAGPLTATDTQAAVEEAAALAVVALAAANEADDTADAAQGTANTALSDAATALAAANEADDTADAAQATADTAITNAAAALAAANEADDTADAAQATVDGHISDPTGAHAATAVSTDDSAWANFTGDDVQAAFDDIDANWPSGGPSVDPTPTINRVISSGNINITNTTYTVLTGMSDIVLPAVAGDTIEILVSHVYTNGAANGNCDVATIVSAAPVTYLSSQTGTPAAAGVPAWLGVGSVFDMAGGSMWLILGAGDVDGGNVTLRQFFRSGNGAGGTKGILDPATYPVTFAARNLGQ